MLHVTQLPAIPPQSRLIFVGDIHGCIDEFNHLLHECRFNAANDRLVLVGDLVNKGYDSIAVVRRAMQLKAYCVLGNHDAALISRYDLIQDGDIDPTQPPYAEDPMTQTALKLPRDCYEYLTSMPHVIKIPQFDVIVVHAGVNPTQKLDDQNLWELLHMRRILPNGRVIDSQAGGDLWATKWKGPQTIIFGHDARTGLQKHQFAIGLDTGCCYGGDLTAYLLPRKQFIKVPGSRRGVTKKPANASPATAIGFSPSVEAPSAIAEASKRSPATQQGGGSGSGTRSPLPVAGSASSLTDQLKGMLSIGKPPTPATDDNAGHKLMFPAAPSSGSTPASQPSIPAPRSSKSSLSPEPAAAFVDPAVASASAAPAPPAAVQPAPAAAPQPKKAKRSPAQKPATPPTAVGGGADVGSSSALLSHIVSTAADMLDEAAVNGQHQLGSFGLRLLSGDAVDDAWEDLVSSGTVSPDVWARLVRGLVGHVEAATCSEHEARDALSRIVDVLDGEPNVAKKLDRRELSRRLSAATSAPKTALRSAQIALRG